mmetsp:Transcript_825/g.2273  ORF Transcript_825/g.2273 Transcript_825/m.2273 type:complete len:363 (+) Transcript_825:59-1147(+)
MPSAPLRVASACALLAAAAADACAGLEGCPAASLMTVQLLQRGFRNWTSLLPPDDEQGLTGPTGPGSGASGTWRAEMRSLSNAAASHGGAAALLAVGNQTAAVVVSRLGTDDTSWLRALGGIPHTLYTEGLSSSSLMEQDPTIRAKPMAKAGPSTRECGGYLAYIIANYEKLPKVVAFLQGQPLEEESSGWEHGDWHTDSHYKRSILNMAKSPNRVGYCALNAVFTDWTGSHDNRPWYIESWKRNLDDSMKEHPGRFDVLNQTVRPLLPSTGVSCFCCAQFAVSRDRIRRHPKIFYEQLLDFIMEEKPSTWQGPKTNVRCSLMERTWHVIFGEPAVCSSKKSSCRVVFEGARALSLVRHMRG